MTQKLPVSFGGVRKKILAPFREAFMKGIVEDYVKKIDKLVEVDYGDFKRKLGQYLIRIEESLGAQARPEAKRTLAELRNRLIYNPQFNDMEEAREYAMEKLRKL
jgi:hypothetical protein